MSTARRLSCLRLSDFQKNLTWCVPAQFGLYVMFPIGIMYYFGTNLDHRFAVPDFWPKPEHANKVPLEREEIHAELERLRAKRLYIREKRLAAEAQLAAQNQAQQQQQDN